MSRVHPRTLAGPGSLARSIRLREPSALPASAAARSSISGLGRPGIGYGALIQDAYRPTGSGLRVLNIRENAVEGSVVRGDHPASGIGCCERPEEVTLRH